jgi:3-methyladenine DNA glycosylase AlkC
MPELFKDYLDTHLIETYAQRLQEHHSTFDAPAFIAQASTGLDAMPMKTRSKHIARALHDHLPAYPQGIVLVCELLAWDARLYKGFNFMPIAQYVEDYGIDDLDASMNALYRITQAWTGEFAIRPLIERYPDEVWAYLLRWSEDDNHHIRRLVSEGTRPRLPWGAQLRAFIADPAPLFELLTPMIDDASEYVRRSVANNLNDISKDHPGRLLDFLRPYAKSESEGTRWIVKHALRTLIKQGNPDALELLGYGVPDVTLESLTIVRDVVHEGESLEFTLALHNATTSTQALMLDYIVYYMKANGEHRPKVFKLSKRTLAPDERLVMTRNHSFKPVTTRKHYAGEHRIALQINGVLMGDVAFMLVVG